ncbi:MAG: saccharopine dehydrogenase NADP-binding domain-containing protein, partial [Gammaproteobacteria bacterium]
MKKVAVIGGGKIGSMIVDLLAHLLAHSGDYAVTVADRSDDQLDRLETDAPGRE